MILLEEEEMKEMKMKGMMKMRDDRIEREQEDPHESFDQRQILHFPKDPRPLVLSGVLFSRLFVQLLPTHSLHFLSPIVLLVSLMIRMMDLEMKDLTLEIVYFGSKM